MSSLKVQHPKLVYTCTKVALSVLAPEKRTLRLGRRLGRGQHSRGRRGQHSTGGDVAVVVAFVFMHKQNAGLQQPETDGKRHLRYASYAPSATPPPPLPDVRVQCGVSYLAYFCAVIVACASFLQLPQSVVCCLLVVGCCWLLLPASVSLAGAIMTLAM